MVSTSRYRWFVFAVFLCSCCSINKPTPEATKPMAAKEYRIAAMLRAALSQSLLVSNHDSPDQPIQDLYSINRRLTVTYQK